MEVVCLFLVLGMVANSLGQRECPPEPEFPNQAVVMPGAEIRMVDNLVEQLLEDWFRDNSRGRRDVSNNPQLKNAIVRTLKNREKRRGGLRRKEYRQLTRAELNRWHMCLQSMKTNGIYDDLTRLHESSISPGAHGGVAFVLWHRLYLWEFERRMRTIPGCARATIPYWDSALDSILPNPPDSVLWTDEFWGEHTGPVRTGLAANWLVTEGCQVPRGFTLRRIIRGGENALYSRQEILDIQVARTFRGFVIPVVENQRRLENAHNTHHTYFGGNNVNGSHLAQLKCAPSDPVFWMLHSMVDKIFDEWSRLPGRSIRRREYPIPGQDGVTLQDMGRTREGVPPEQQPYLRHLANAPMHPFVDRGRQLQNRDGLRRRYRCPYTIRPSRDRCVRDADCAGQLRMMFCDACNRCSSKVREGGRCDNLADRACYCSEGTPRCIRDSCRCT